jgi:hypothetical protein
MYTAYDFAWESKTPFPEAIHEQPHLSRRVYPRDLDDMGACVRPSQQAHCGHSVKT